MSGLNKIGQGTWLRTGKTRLGLKTKPVVFLAATRAGGTRMLALNSVEVPAFHTLKGHVTAFGLEPRMVPAVVVNPQPEEYGGDEEAVDYRGNDEVHYETGRSGAELLLFRKRRRRRACYSKIKSAVPTERTAPCLNQPGLVRRKEPRPWRRAASWPSCSPDRRPSPTRSAPSRRHRCGRGCRACKCGCSRPGDWRIPSRSR
jgi:hypothetical protein